MNARDRRVQCAVARGAYIAFGCKVNQYESDRIRERLEAAGVITSGVSGADMVVLNTCSVTAHADAKSRAAIRKARRDRPGALIVVTGCAVEAAGAPAAFEGADLVVGNAAKDALWTEVLRAKPEWLGAPAPMRMEPRTRAIVQIQDGCDVGCTYCSIPRTRSAMRSKPAQDVLDEVRRQVDLGHHEVVLTGILLGSYGPDSGSGGPRFEDLIESVAAIPGLARLRLSSVELWHVGPRLIDLLAAGALVPHLHLPLQSGDDRVLAAMGRPYRRADILRLRDELCSRIPDVTMTSDFLIGFPNETCTEFEETLRLSREMGLYRGHVFPYSPRPGAEASGLGDPVPGHEKRRRREALSRAIEETAAAHAARFVGGKRRALFEATQRDGLWRGTLDNSVEVFARSSTPLGRTLQTVRILRSEGGTLFGEVLKGVSGADD